MTSVLDWLAAHPHGVFWLILIALGTGVLALAYTDRKRP
jgi:hypothetical protein